MNRVKLFSATLALIALTGYTSQSQTNLRSRGIAKIKIPMHTGWQFREAGKDTWYAAIVPGSVHTDLLNNKLIDDPFFRDNEQRLQWIGKTWNSAVRQALLQTARPEVKPKRSKTAR